MLTAKKVVSTRLELSVIRGIDTVIDEFLSGRVSAEQIRAYLLQRFGNGTSTSFEVRIVDRVAELRWTSAKTSAEAEIFHKEALAFARRKDYRQAVQKWVQAVASNPEDPDYYFNLGIALFEAKKYNEAVENLKKVIGLCPIYQRAHLILGTVCLKIRKFADAEIHLKESIYFNPQNALAHLNLGAVFSILKKYDEGIRSFRRTLELSPSEVRAYFGLAKIYSIRGDVDNANVNYRRVIELDTLGVLANHAKRSIVGRSDSKAGNLDEIYSEGYKAFLYSDYKRAIDLYRRYVEAKPEDDYVWSALGEALLRNGQVEHAVETFRQAVKIAPSKGLYLKQLAIACDFLERPQEVVDAARKANESGKADSITLGLLGKNLAKLNRVSEAIPLLEQAIRSNRSNLQAQLSMAAARVQNNEREVAMEYLVGILQSKINSPIKAEAERMLSKLR